MVTGTFLTGDPSGFKDGPNRYCYVHCNPINKFDAVGLSATGIPVLDRYDIRSDMDQAWGQSIRIPGPKGFEWLYNKQDSHEHGFVVMNDGSKSEIYKGRDDDSFQPRPEHLGQVDGMYFHTHPESIWDLAQRGPSGPGRMGAANQCNDLTFAKNNGTVVTIFEGGISVTTPDGQTFYLNRNDIKPGELEGSASFYKSREDMEKGENGMTRDEYFEQNPAAKDVLMEIGAGSSTEPKTDTQPKTENEVPKEEQTTEQEKQPDPIVVDDDTSTSQ